MKVQETRLLLAGIVSLCLVSSLQAVTTQRPEDVLPNGSAFLWVEAEDVAVLDGDPATGFVVVDKVNPIKTIAETSAGDPVTKGGLDVLPADTNASGGAAIFDLLGGAAHANTATWEIQFITPATYYLYVHASIYNSDTNSTYGNEDSFFLPPSLNANSSDDWIGFLGVDQAGDPLIGDSSVDGWMPVFNNKVVVSGGVQEVHNDTNEDFWDGQFHWMFADFAIDSDENGRYLDDFGIAIRYEISEADINKVQTFQISSREPYGVLDAFLFSTSNELLLDFTQEQMDEFFLNRVVPVPGDFDGSGALDLPDVNMLNAEIAAGANNAPFDLNSDAAVNDGDLVMWIKDLRKTWFGDANLDGEFNSGDLVAVFQAGKFEQGTAATWGQGDWNGDLRFNSGDLVKAFQDGGFERGPVAAGTVPEPSGWILWPTALALVARRRRR